MSTPEGRTLPDHHGNPIAVGATVRQRNIFDSSGGALLINAGQTGKVTEVRIKRVVVDFPRQSMYAFRASNGTAPPIAIRAEYVEVVASATDDQEA